MIIRPEKKEDIEAIHSILRQAFSRPEEARLVDELRGKYGSDVLSLVAEDESQVVGHILFSSVVIEGDQKKLKGMGLAPMAVLPSMHRSGIGSKLVSTGLEMLKKSGVPFIVVLGHPDYYPRFGFEPASRYGIRPQWEGVPDYVFMILWFTKPAPQITGTAVFLPEFSKYM